MRCGEWTERTDETLPRWGDSSDRRTLQRVWANVGLVGNDFDDSVQQDQWMDAHTWKQVVTIVSKGTYILNPSLSSPVGSTAPCATVGRCAPVSLNIVAIWLTTCVIVALACACVGPGVLGSEPWSHS